MANEENNIEQVPKPPQIVFETRVNGYGFVLYKHGHLIFRGAGALIDRNSDLNINDDALLTVLELVLKKRSKLDV